MSRALWILGRVFMLGMYSLFAAETARELMNGSPKAAEYYTDEEVVEEESETVEADESTED